MIEALMFLSWPMIGGLWYALYRAGRLLVACCVDSVSAGSPVFVLLASGVVFLWLAVVLSAVLLTAAMIVR